MNIENLMEETEKVNGYQVKVDFMMTENTKNNNQDVDENIKDDNLMILNIEVKQGCYEKVVFGEEDTVEGVIRRIIDKHSKP